MASWTKRGRGTCPSCGKEYSNRYKPTTCPGCEYELGGSCSKPKKPHLVIPKCTLVASNPDGTWYSCNTSTHDDRCLAFVDGNSGSVICYHHLCKQQRALYINSNKIGEFSCQHLKYIADNVSDPIRTFHDLPNLSTYPCDDITRKCLEDIVDLAGALPIAVKVSHTMFCVYGISSTNNPAGYCHVKVKDEEIHVRCCSKDCKMFIAKAKQLKSKAICLHIHILLCLQVVLPAGKELESSNANQEDEEFQETNQARNNTITLKMKSISIPEKIPASVIRQSGMIDANSGWPEVLEPCATNCLLCGSKLGPSKKHPGSRGNSYIITNMNPFLKTKVLVKICVNESCLAMNQVIPYEQGLFNISDKVLVSLEILLEWRQLFRRGVPISIAINSKLEAMVERAQEHPTKNEIENISKLLYNGFYCFEAMTDRNLDSVICGLCGITGEVYLGDGNEKNCCSINQIDYSHSSASIPIPLSLEEFLSRLKRQWVESSTYTRSARLTFGVSEIPPIIAPSMRGDIVYNTELKKNSTVLKAHGKKTEGDPAMLHSIIKDQQLDMNNLKDVGLEGLKQICSKCEISTSKKSQAQLKADIQCLYETLLIGSSPCHNFTKVPRHTGGFYHIVCRHGVTAASKFLTLQESVRDAADLYLSLKHYPLVFLCDTACGFVRHMDCRVPELTDKIWGKFCGCFEEPKLGVSPNKGMNVPIITTAEYRDREAPMFESSDSTVHPLSGESRRYVLGDRFHNASNPHKSPLCLYHDINLAEQSNAIKTSYQESENNRKNVRRLRSSCVQSFDTHFIYNFLMDYYQNQEIVTEQYRIASMNLKDGQKVVRDSYMRFVIQN